MRIGIIIYGSLETVSGGYLYDRMLVSHLRDRDDEVQVISLPRRSYAGCLLQNLSFRSPVGFDILLQDELNHPSLLGANAGRRESPIISIVHNLRSAEQRRAWQNGLYRRVERRYLESVDGFIFNSESTRASVAALVGAGKAHVVASPGGDRLGESTPDQIRARALEGGPLRLLFLANVTAGKGLEIALDALATLPRMQYSLDVVGSCDTEPVYARRMRRKAMDLQLPVVFHGTLEKELLARQLDQAQVLVLPSRYEGFGIAFLEGMAHGLPALGTSVGAIPELVDDGKNGYLIEPGDAQRLARRLDYLAGHRERVAELGISALISYRSRPTWSQSMEDIRQFLVAVRGRWDSADA
jgi:glycosyltransferase involved in cell wall biosynthesis